MKLLQRYNQHRRDCYIDIECEGCSHKMIEVRAYDDRNFWDNVVPNLKCPICWESTISLGKEVEKVWTKYADYEVV